MPFFSYMFAGDPIITFHTRTPCFMSSGTVLLLWRSSRKISSVNVSIVIPMYRLTAGIDVEPFDRVSVPLKTLKIAV